MIAAVGRNRVIGTDGALPWSLPADLKRFRVLTVGKPVIMGRATHESIGRPLPDRTNIVLSRNEAYSSPGTTTASTPQAALTIAENATGPDGDVCVIGGEIVYSMYVPMADRLELTRVEASPRGDAYFPAWRESDLQLVFSETHQGSPSFEFQTLVRSA